MAERLNNIIRALESGQHALTCFAPAEISSAVAMSASKYDACVFEMEHNPWDGRLLRDCLQYMLNRAQIAKAGLVPPVNPLVRIPVNGIEMAQWQAKQALDMGCYGIVFPHISTVEEAANAVGACRYPRLKSAKYYEPVGIRGGYALQLREPIALGAARVLFLISTLGGLVILAGILIAENSRGGKPRKVIVSSEVAEAI